MPASLCVPFVVFLPSALRPLPCQGSSIEVILLSPRRRRSTLPSAPPSFSRIDSRSSASRLDSRSSYVNTGTASRAESSAAIMPMRSVCLLGDPSSRVGRPTTTEPTSSSAARSAMIAWSRSTASASDLPRSMVFSGRASCLRVAPATPCAALPSRCRSRALHDYHSGRRAEREAGDSPQGAIGWRQVDGRWSTDRMHMLKSRFTLPLSVASNRRP